MALDDDRMLAAGDRASVLTSIGARLGRDTTVYALAMAVTLPFGLLNVAVLTRLLTPADYGVLAVLLVSAGLLTTVYNVGTLQGTFALVYGAGAGDGDADDGIEAGTEGAVAPRAGVDKRVLLTTGVVVTCAVLVVSSLPLLALAPQVATVLLDDGDRAEAVRWAVASAAAGSTFRLTVNVFRMERRPVVYGVLNTLRPAASLGIAIPLVVAGAGVDGVLAGIAAGTMLTTACAIVIGRRLYARSAVPGLAREILRRGLPAIPVAIGVWTVQNADTLLLSLYEPDGEVGAYRVANRLAAIMLFGVSAFLMASGPLERTSLVRAAHDRFSRVHVRSLLVTYYTIAGIYAVLAVTLGTDALVLVAAPGYRAQAGLIPILAAGSLGYGLLILLTRVAVVPRRGPRHRVASMVVGAAFVVVASALIRWLDALGAALALPIVMTGACAYWWVLIHRSTEPLVVPWPRVLGAVAIATAAYGLSLAAGDLGPGGRSVADVAAAIACPLLFVATGVVPRHHIGPLWRIARSALGGSRWDRDLFERMARLEPSQREALRAAAGSPRAHRGTDAPQLLRGLEVVAGVRVQPGSDEELASYLLDTGPSPGDTSEP